jgi:AbrB family looped-hinge helix DNA binding protein
MTTVRNKGLERHFRDRWLTINSKGQLWIPVTVRSKLGWRPGETVVVTIEDAQAGEFSVRKASPEEVRRASREAPGQ